MKLEFTVDGKPIGKARPRVTKRATYTPATTTRYEDLVRYAALNNLKEDFEENEPLSVEVIAFFEVPKSYSRNKKQIVWQAGSYLLRNLMLITWARSSWTA